MAATLAEHVDRSDRRRARPTSRPPSRSSSNRSESSTVPVLAHISAAGVRHTLDTELAPLRECAVSTDRINGLANRWSAQLRRAAWRRHAPLLLFRSTAEADAIVGQAQVALVEESPWAHTDRLLVRLRVVPRRHPHPPVRPCAEVGTLSPVASSQSSAGDAPESTDSGEDQTPDPFGDEGRLVLTFDLDDHRARV